MIGRDLIKWGNLSLNYLLCSFFVIDRYDNDVKYEEIVKYSEKEKFGDKDYELYCVIDHIGLALDWGNYFAYVKNTVDNKWYKTDDS